MSKTKLVKTFDRICVIPAELASWKEAFYKKAPWVSIVASRKNPGQFFPVEHNFPQNVYTGSYLGNFDNTVRRARARLTHALKAKK